MALQVSMLLTILLCRALHLLPFLIRICVGKTTQLSTVVSIFALFNNRVQLTIDAYKNSAKDLLLSVPIPSTTGYSSQLQNIGATSNTGLEIQLGATPLQKKNFTWNTNFNIAFNKNKVKSLGGVQEQTRNSGWQGSDGVDDYLVKVGQPIGLMYGFVTDGWYTVDDFNYNATTQAYTIKPGIAVNGVYGTPQPGMLKWKDLDGDGQYNCR